jgi:hypothetical protein
MPARRKRAGTPMRTRPPKDKLVELCLDMEDALDQVVDVAHALRLIGHGLGHRLNQSAADEQEGRAVAAVASTACERLDTLRQAWRDLCKFTLRTR